MSGIGGILGMRPKPLEGTMIKGSHFDYVHQAWTKDGKYVRCGHPASMNCDCYGKAHEGETANPNDLPTADEEEMAVEPSWSYTAHSVSELMRGR